MCDQHQSVKLSDDLRDECVSAVAHRVFVAKATDMLLHPLHIISLAAQIPKECCQPIYKVLAPQDDAPVAVKLAGDDVVFGGV